MKVFKYLIGLLFFGGSFFLFYDSVIDNQNEKILYPYRMKIYFPEALGIREGTEVTLKGINFGVVRELKEISVYQIEDPRFTTNSDRAVEITLSVKKPVTLWDNYKIKFKSKTVFSGRFIDIDPGSHDGLSDSFFNPTFEPGNDDDKSASAEYYDEFFTAANNVLIENKQDIRTTVSNLNSISTKMNSGEGSFSQFINKTTAYDNLSETVADTRIIGNEARRYYEMIRENDNIPTTFTMVVIFNILNLNILSRGQ